MENFVNGLLGGEFRRHFWPGLLLNILIILSIYLHNPCSKIFDLNLVASISVTIPLSVLTGVIMDVIGHIFVNSTATRKEAIKKSKLVNLVYSISSKSIERYITDKDVLKNKEEIMSYLCFYLTKTINNNLAGQKKFEEQFSYFEFNRSLTLFFVPLTMYIVLTILAKTISNNLFMTIILPSVFYFVFQVLILRLAWIIFHIGRKGLIYKIGRWYFHPVFYTYNIIVNIQLGMLLDFFIRNENTANNEELTFLMDKKSFNKEDKHKK